MAIIASNALTMYSSGQDRGMSLTLIKSVRDKAHHRVGSACSHCARDPINNSVTSVSWTSGGMLMAM
jgi:hypothetical protein